MTNYKLPVYFKGLVLFVFVLCIYGFFLVLIGDDIYWQTTGRNLRKYLFLVWLIPALLSVFPVYVFSCEGFLNEQKMKILFFIFFVCSIIAFYGGLEQQKAYALMFKTNQEEYTVTSVYAFLSILPLTILFKKKQLLQFLLLGVMCVYFALSAKRGAIILGSASVVLIVLSMFSHSAPGKKISIVILTIGFIFGVQYFINYQMENSPYFASKIDRTFEGYASGRDEYAKIIFDHYTYATNTRQFFFGIGAQGTLSVNENFAHNDWLAILLEHGLFGAFLYAIYWAGFIYTWIKSKINFDAFVVIGLLLLIGFGKSIFSMFYLPISPEMMMSSGYFSIVLGFYLAKVFPQKPVFELSLSQK